MLLAWLVLTPALLLAVLLAAAWLEAHIVSPGERARAISDILTSRARADEVEAEVARLLRVCDPPRRVAPRGLDAQS